MPLRSEASLAEWRPYVWRYLHGFRNVDFTFRGLVFPYFRDTATIKREGIFRQRF
jgi:hypothetical protein